TQASNASVAMRTARSAQVGRGESDASPSRLAVVPAVDGVGEKTFQRERVQRAEEGLLREFPRGKPAMGQLDQDGVLVPRGERHEGLAEALRGRKIEQARQLVERRAQRGELPRELALDEAADVRFARAGAAIRRQD